MYYSSLGISGQLDITKDPIHCVVIVQEHFGAVSTAFDLEHHCVAEMSGVGDANELA